MLEDYIEKLARKREEFDDLVEEQRQLLAVVDGGESQQVRSLGVLDVYFLGEFRVSDRFWILSISGMWLV